MKTTTGGAWASIRDECTLAKPELIYSHENITADFGTDIDLELGEGERLWVGYIEDMEIYRFYGKYSCCLQVVSFYSRFRNPMIINF